MIKEFFRKLTIFFSIYLITFAPVLAEINNNALPTNPNITSGSATINQTSNSLTINQTTNKLITNWTSFNIGKDASVEFVQPNSSSTALNRVNASDPSYIYGSLKANGKIILINPSGVLFQGGSKVDVGAIIASSLNLKDGDFLNNKYIFEKDGLAGTVNNSGTINAFKGGAVALLSDQVTNNGIINTPDGTTALLSGEKITLTLNGNRLIKYTIDRGTLNALVENKQAIDAGDGIIILSAKGLTDVSQSVVKNTGTLTAESISKQGGKIYLSAREGEVINSGTLSTNSTEDKGGNIEITGDEITIEENSTLTATGTTGGGQILVGGSWKNSDSSVYQSTVTTVQQNTLIDASATVNGDGGEIVIWSDITNKDSVTTVSGTLYAKGGSQKGDGGRIETSGHYLDSENASISTKAVYGNNGMWLLDPYSLYIGNIDNDNISTFIDDSELPELGYSKLNLSTLYTRLAGNNVTLEATNDINLAAEFNYTGPSRDLIFEAPTIAISGNITSTNPLNLVFGSEVDGSQNVFLTGSSTITSGNGSISFYGNIGGAHSLTIDSGIANTILNSATGGFNGSYWTGASSSSPVNVEINFGGSRIPSYVDFSTRTTSGEPSCGSDDCIPSVFSTSSRTFVKLPTQGENVTVTYADETTEVIGTEGTGSNAGIYIPAGKTIKRFDFTTSTGVPATISSDVNVDSYTSNSFSNAPTLSSLTVYGGDINLDGDIHTTDAGINGNVFIQAARDIYTTVGISVLTSGGDITFSSDSDYSNEGGIILETGVTLNSGGGDITLGGRSPADDYAVGSEGSQYRGIWIIGSMINAGGGNIILNGKGTQSDDSVGEGYAGTGVDLDGSVGSLSLRTTDSGTIEINGVGGENSSVHAVGINITDAVEIQTDNGNISLTGTAGTGDASEDSAILIDGAMVSTIYSSYGNINLTGIGGSNSIKNNNSFFNVGSDGTGDPSAITNGNISLIADSIDSTTGLFDIKGRGTFTVAPYGDDFTSSLSWPINNVSITGISDLTIGKASSADGTNDQDVAIDDSISFSGPVTIYGGNINLNSQITSGSGSDVVIVASGDFVNSQGNEVISTPGGGRWIVYTANDDNPENFGSEGLLDSSNTPIWGSTYSSLSPDSVASGNRYVFAESAPGQSVTFTTTDASKIYGSTIDLSSYYTIVSGGISALDGVYLATPAGGSVSIGDIFSSNPTFSTSGSDGTLANTDIGDYTITAASGTANSGYTVTYANTGTLSISAKPITVSGISASNKTYNGNTTATIDTSTVNQTDIGVVAGDTVTISATGLFSDKNVGSSKTVTLTSSYGGADATNYTFTDQASTTADITAKAITVSGITASNKTYNGNTTATIDTSTVNQTDIGVVAGDTVTISATGLFSDKNVGSSKTVTLTSSYGGADATNYTFTDQASTTADITAKAITVSGITASDKVFDDTTSATIDVTGINKSGIGIVSGDTVNIAATGTFNNKNVATNKTVTLTSAYSGADATNYTFTDQASTTADVTKASPSISGLSNQTKTTSDSSFTVAGTPSISGLPITYESSDTDVATVISSTGVVNIVGAGTTTITARILGKPNYNAATSTYTLTVTQASGSSSGSSSSSNAQKASDNAVRNATNSIPKNNTKNTPTVNPTAGGGGIPGSQPLINFGGGFSGGGGANIGGGANTTAGTGQGAGGPGDGTGPGQGAGQGLGPQGGGSSGGGIINLGGGSSGGGGANTGGSANTTAGTGQGAGGPGDGTGPGQGAGQGLGPQGGGSSGGGIINLGGGSSGGGGANIGGGANTTAGTGQGAGGPGDGTGPGQGAGQGLGPQGNNNQQANNSGSGSGGNNNSGSGGGANTGGGANQVAGTGQGAGGPGDGTGPGQGAGQGLGPQGGGNNNQQTNNNQGGNNNSNIGSGGSGSGGGANTGGGANQVAGTGQGAGGPGDGNGPGQGAGQGLGPQGNNNQQANNSGSGSGGNNNNQSGGNNTGSSGSGGGANTGGGANQITGTGQGAGGPGDGNGPGQGAGQGLGPQGNNNQQANNSGSGSDGNNNSGSGSGSGGGISGFFKNLFGGGSGSGGTQQANNPQGGSPSTPGNNNNNQQANNPQGGGGNNNTPTGPGNNNGNQQANNNQGGGNNNNSGGGSGSGGGNNPTNLTSSNVQITSFTVNTDGSISVRKSNLNANVNVNAEGIIPSAQVVVLRPNQTPKVETGYEVQIANNEAKLRPLQNIDQDFVTPGNIIGSTQFRVEVTPGQAFNYTIEVRDGGVVIKPSDAQSIQFAEANRTLVIGSGILEAVNALNIPADQMKTIFLDYQS